MKKTLIAIGAAAYVVAAIIVGGYWTNRTSAATVFLPAAPPPAASPAENPAPPGIPPQIPSSDDTPILTLLPTPPPKASRPAPALVPGFNFVTITNDVIAPSPTGAAFIDITNAVELQLAPFPPGATLLLAIRNPDNFPVAMVYPTNTFMLEQFGPSQFGRYLLRVQNVRGEIWITK